jgi:hypothetical protein
MNNAKVLLFTASFIAFSFAICELVSLIKNRNNVMGVKAKIIDIQFAVSESMKVTNSKSVALEYYVNNKRCVSENRIVVPMHMEIGDSIEVKYFIDNPRLLYTKSVNKFLITMLIGIISLIVGYFTQWSA